MMTPTDQPGQKSRIWFYFLDLKARYAPIPLFLGVALAESALGKVMLLIGLAWIAALIVMGRARPSDEEVDELLSLDLRSLMERAMESLRPREEEMQAAPLALMGPLEVNALDRLQRFTRPRKGTDGRRRSPLNRVVVLLPMEDRLGVYSCNHDSLQGVSAQVSSEAHHYKDVVSIRLERNIEPGAGLDPKYSLAPINQILSLDLCSGRHVSFPASIGYVKGGEGEEPALTNLEKTVRSIQALLHNRR